MEYEAAERKRSGAAATSFSRDGELGNHGRAGIFQRNNGATHSYADLSQVRAGGRVQGHVDCAAQAGATAARADERDRAKFAKAQSYMVRRDEKLACANIRCRKAFEISSLQSVAFIAD